MALSLREKHAEATRRALLDAARKLFVIKGYEESGVDEIAAEAGATRGAVYHHFKGKKEMLEALLEETQAGLVQKVAMASAAESDPWKRMQIGIRVFFDACEDPAARRIVFRDGPAVLGWDTWREVDARHFLGVTVASLRQLIDTGLLPPLDVDTLAHLLMAMFTEGVLLIERAEDPAAARAKVEESLLALLEGLRT